MIERLYVHNFRCLENFEFKPQGASSVLLIGKNGSGKSTLREVLAVFQAIGRGETLVKALASPADFTRGRDDVPMALELTLRMGELRYQYSLAFDLPSGFKALRVLRESVEVDGVVVFSRQLAEVSVSRPGAQAELSVFSMDWHRVALPVIQDRAASRLLQTLRDALRRMVLLSPAPCLMVGETSAEPAPLHATGSNLVDWLSGLLESHPTAYLTVMEQLQQAVPDMVQFRFERLGRDERALMVKFAAGQGEFELPFERLSDGEKCFFLGAVLLAANRWDGPLLAFWDEPDNFVAPHEVGSFVVALKRVFAKHGGQWIASSHNVQTVLNFAMDSTWVLARVSHLEPTRTRCVDEIDLGKGDLVSRLIDGEIDAWL